MSNTQTPGSKRYSITGYRKKVEGKTPFPLYLTDDDVDPAIVIPRPNGNQIFEAEEAMRAGDSKGILKALCGDTFDEFMSVVPKEDAEVMKAIIEDVQAHFGLGE